MNTNHQINPIFPNQEDINAALASLSPELQEQYKKLRQDYEKATSSDSPDHDKIAELIEQGQELLKG